jgi:hypothetical protein
MTQQQILPQELTFICLKFGIQYQSIQIDKADPNVLDVIKKHACEMVQKTVGTLHVHDQAHHVQLFLISPDHQTPYLRLINSTTDLTPTCFIEVIIWRSDQENIVSTRDHILVEHNYKKPTYCSHCDYFMWGLIKQVSRIDTIQWQLKELFYSLSRVNDVEYVDKIFIINGRNICQTIVQAMTHDVIC